MAEQPCALVLTSSSDPTCNRAVCRVCSWASHPGGTTQDLAVAAAIAHVEAAHGGRFTRTEVLT